MHQVLKPTFSGNTFLLIMSITYNNAFEMIYCKKENVWMRAFYSEHSLLKKAALEFCLISNEGQHSREYLKSKHTSDIKNKLGNKIR